MFSHDYLDDKQNLLDWIQVFSVWYKFMLVIGSLGIALTLASTSGILPSSLWFSKGQFG